MSELLRCTASIRVADAARREDEVLHFEIAAGCESSVGFSNYDGSVLEAGDEGVAVGEIECVRKSPVVFGVVDNEVAVGGILQSVRRFIGGD